jgi:hypothetical protein
LPLDGRFGSLCAIHRMHGFFACKRPLDVCHLVGTVHQELIIEFDKVFGQFAARGRDFGSGRGLAVFAANEQEDDEGEQAEHEPVRAHFG